MGLVKFGFGLISIDIAKSLQEESFPGDPIMMTQKEGR